MANDTERQPRDSSPALIGLLLLGLGAGTSPFFFAYYDASVWVPIGLGLVLVCAVCVMARPPRLSGPAMLTLAGLCGLGVWSLISVTWAESVENAVVSGNRWLVYGALMGLILMLLRSERRSALLMGAATLGVIAVAVSVLARLLGSHPQTLFLGARLNSPLGYINGEGCLFVVGFWLCFAVVEDRRAPVAALAAGMATLMGCLAILTQSRGTALGMLVALIAVVIAVPGRTRRIYGLMVVAGAVALATPDLLHVYDNASAGSVSVEASHVAGHATLLAAVAGALAWGLLTLVWEGVAARQVWALRARRMGSWLLVIPLVLALVFAVSDEHRIDRSVRTQWHDFTNLAEPSYGGGADAGSQSRLFSGAGNRYDYWRIAWRVWRAHPALGVGAGNYPRSYYQQRATTEDIEQPHSIELQTLSELGVVGALLLIALLAGTVWGIVRMRSNAVSSQRGRALMVGATGAFVAWLTQTSVDWMHLLPGLTAIAVIAVAVLVRGKGSHGYPEREGSTEGLRLGSVRTIKLAAALVVLAVAGASLSRQGLADIYRVRAQNELDAHPASALRDVDRSLNIDSDAVESYYVKAAAFARFDQAAAAESALGEALEREPNNFVTWTLLGDIHVRERKIAAAKRDYGRAHRLNPRNSTLTELATDPSSSLR
jgi:O-Antigen ligase